MQNREKHDNAVNVGESTFEHVNMSSSSGWYQGPLTE